MFVDSHSHIDGPEYDADREQVIENAAQQDVRYILTVGTGDPYSGNFERAVNLSNTYRNIFSAVGTHPHDARLYDDRVETLTADLIQSNLCCIAWGEIGLDYHYDHSPRDIQRQVFRRQLRAARECDVPVIVHTREADADTLAIIREEYSGTLRGGIMHCFGGPLELAQKAIELGFLISFSGNISFKKAQNVRDVARQLPLDQVLIETDSPYLSPEPFRGRRNEPARVVEVARVIGDLHNRSKEEIGEITSSNFLKFFALANEKLNHQASEPESS